MALEINDILAESISGSSISAQTYYIGTQNINTIFAPYIPGGYLPLTGGTISGNLSANTINASIILSGNNNINNIFLNKNGLLLQKSNFISGSTFSGNPKKATVIFVTPYLNNDYAISISSDINRTWTVENKTTTGFTINANANNSFNSNNVFWMTTEFGEGFK